LAKKFICYLKNLKDLTITNAKLKRLMEAFDLKFKTNLGIWYTKFETV
jgi:hypothetical protein